MLDKKWRWVVVNSSGGKDSQTALRYIIREARRVGFPRDRIVVSHQFLAEEWPGSDTLAREQAEHYGVRFLMSRYRDRNGEELSLLDYVRRRGKFPDNANRWCTSEFKRGPGNRIITRLSREAPGDILQVFGFRAQESPARRKRPEVMENARASSKKRTVVDWLPIHKMTEEEVWDDIRASGVRWHKAYDLGMPRLSCQLCIFAPEAALIIAGKANPELLDEYIAVEEETGHTFQNGKSLKDIRRKIERGVTPGPVNGAWNM